jgi:hypothetical protein
MKMMVWGARSLALWMCVSATLVGCSGADEKKDETEMPEVRQNTKETRNELGQIVRSYDGNGDDKPDVIRYLDEVPDPEDPSLTIRKLRKMELDVNFDGRIDVIRVYDEAGKLRSEESDIDLDGTADIVSYYDRGALAKKEILEAGSRRILATRFYTGGNVLRVEKDTNGDGRIDYWEYYEQGVLDRIGRDFNGDERADSWQKR